MKRIIAIGGEPATGKTTLVRRIMEELGLAGFREFSYGLVRGHIHAPSGVVLLGKYPVGETFAGTDRLSMAVIKDATTLLAKSDELGYGGFTLLFEGDRLFNQTYIQTCRERAPTDVIVLTAPNEVKEARHRKRGDKQTEVWLKGRITKIQNIVKAIPVVNVMMHETAADTANIAAHVVARIRS